MCHIGPYVHEVGNAVLALALGIALEELAHLEEEHHEDSFGKLRLCPWQEAYAQRTDGGHCHEEVLIERLTMSQALYGLMQRLVPYEQIWY